MQKKADRGYILAVLPGDRILNMQLTAALLGARKIGFVAPEELRKLTGCVSGAVPPLPLHNDIRVVADSLLRQNSKMVFNAGQLDVSIQIMTDDYFRKLTPLAWRISDEKVQM